MKNPLSRPTSVVDMYEQTTAEAIDEATTTYLQPQDTVTAAAMPTTISGSHSQLLWEERTKAQPPLHDADGEALARDDTVRAAENLHPSDVGKTITKGEAKLVKVTRKNLEYAENHLRPLCRRGKYDTLIYYGFLGVMIAGDSTGISQPLINYGEVPALAIAQSASAAVAMVAAGLAGRRSKDIINAIERAQAYPDGIPEHLKKYSTRFRDAAKIPWFTLGAAIVIGVIPVGIGLLRYVVDGSVFGLVFALIAIGVMVASGVTNFWYTDDVADALDDVRKQYKRSVKGLRKASQAKPIKQAAGSAAAATSIKAEQTLRGEGAVHETKALPHLVHQNNGHIFGHGIPAQHQAPPASIIIPQANSNGHKETVGQQ